MIKQSADIRPTEELNPLVIRTIIDRLPRYQAMQAKRVETIEQELADIEKREALVHEIAEHVVENPELFNHSGEDVGSIENEVNGQIESLEQLLALEREEFLRNIERKAAIENDPERKGLLDRAVGAVKRGWEKVKEHKWKILIALAAIAAGIAIWYWWDFLAGLFPGLKLSSEVATEKAAETAAGGAAETATAIASEAVKDVPLYIDGHSIFLEGVEFASKDPASLEKLSSALAELAKENPGFIPHIYNTESARALPEAILKQQFGEMGIHPRWVKEFIEKVPK